VTPVQCAVGKQAEGGSDGVRCGMGLESLPRHDTVGRNVVTLRPSELAIGERKRQSQRTIGSGIC